MKTSSLDQVAAAPSCVDNCVLKRLRQLRRDVAANRTPARLAEP